MSTPIVLKDDSKACISFSGNPNKMIIVISSDEGVQRSDISMEYIETKF